MGINHFPNIRWGNCPVCGADGGDYAASELSEADSSSDLDTTGNGVLLEYYQGELMCRICVKRKKADVESRVAASKHAEAEEFRQKAGFTKEVE